MYSYTVRPMAEKIFHPFIPGQCSYELVKAGACVTVRNSLTGKVVQQFPRVANEQAGHRVAQFWIAKQKRLIQGFSK